VQRCVAVVEEYLRSMVDHDWDALAATLAPDVVRSGPYLDDYRGAPAYVGFLAETVPALDHYELEVARVWGDGDGRVCAELSETVTLGGGRLRTDEAIVFDVDEFDRIVAVQVFLRKSYDPTEVNTDI
jgi:limonene-1,2-epoxide hydrolase